MTHGNDKTTTAQVMLNQQVPVPEHDPMLPFYAIVRRATEALGFRNYSNFLNSIFSDRGVASNGKAMVAKGVPAELTAEHFCFTGTRAYDQIRKATDLFIASQPALLESCTPWKRGDAADELSAKKSDAEGEGHGHVSIPGFVGLDKYDLDELNRRFAPESLNLHQLNVLAEHLFDIPGEHGHFAHKPREPSVTKRPRSASRAAEADAAATGSQADDEPILTYMRGVNDSLSQASFLDFIRGTDDVSGALLCKLRCPPLLELIWSYWMEQGMLVQGLNALTLRFQNRRYPGHEALQRCDMSSIRLLGNVIWGYIQREPDRLSVARRAYEYDHHYGLRIRGAAVPALSPADTRTRFIEAFHRLLQEANRYYRTAMDTTMNADAFPVLNCLRELNVLLAEGANNQFGDLPTTARAEMLIQQWILARPEVRDFLGGKPGVPYPENWMPHMDTLRTLMSWNDASIRHYRDLAVYGEQLLLSVRYLPWTTVNNSTLAAGWLTYWRPEVQGYLHSYRAVTGVELGTTDTPVVQGGLLTAQPADLIGRGRVVMPAMVPR
jgi:hypothetical protein